jgi:acetolactate synthase-1/2/3 large subunit
MGQALADSVPMLVVTSNNADGRAGAGLGALHDLPDQSALAAGVTRWSRKVASPEDLSDALDAAMETFSARRPGPVHIEIGVDAQHADAPAFRDPRPATEPPEPDREALLRAGAALSAAARPALVFGGGAVGLGDLAARLAQTLAAPTLLTSNARGLLPPNDPLLFSAPLYSAAALALLAEADCVLAIGTEFGETDWSFYDTPPLAFAEGALIRVDIDAAQLGRNAEPHLAFQADASAFVRALLDVMEPREAASPDLAPALKAARAEIPERYARHKPLLDGIYAALPDAAVIGDSTEPAYYGLVAAAPPRPRGWWTSATGYGTLGYALPAAIGARLADPSRPVVALMGDGGALFTLPELASAVEAETPVILIVWNNNGYGEIREVMREQEIARVGVNLAPVDFQSLARGFGAAFARVNGARYLHDALKAAATRKGPTVLELRDDYWFGAA